MIFEARLFIQGVANFVPHDDGEQLLVLFPEQRRYSEEAFPQIPKGRVGGDPDDEVCAHHAVVQMDVRHLTGTGRDELQAPWATLHAAGHWIGFESDSNEGMGLTGGVIPGLPSIEEVLEAAGVGGFSALDPRVLPTTEDFDPPSDVVAAGLYLDSGKVSPESDYEGAFTFHPVGAARASHANALLDERMLSSVIKVELGRVSRLRLLLRPFGSREVARIELQPVGDMLDVWVRHFCSLERPDSERELPEAGSIDADFLLNYLPRKDLPGLLQNAGERLPVPKVSHTWLRGGPIGGDPRKCMGGREAYASYSKPLR